MIIRLTIQQAGAAFRATLSKRDDQGNGEVGQPEIFLVTDKEEAKKRARDLARSLGLKTYRVIDRTLKVSSPESRPDPANPINSIVG